MTDKEREMVAELCELEDGLYEGELRFVEDLSGKPDYLLNKKQKAWLQKIWDRLIG